MKIRVDGFCSNDPDLSLEDFIFNIKGGVTPEGVVNIEFDTAQKYYDVKCNVSIFTSDFSGIIISITPHIYDEQSASYLEDDEFEGAYGQYLDHPDYFSIRLVVECDTNYSAVVTPLKYNYFVSLVPDAMVMNYDCLEDIELIEMTD